MNLLRTLIFAVLLFGAFASCKNDKSEHSSIATEEISFRKDGELTFYDPDGSELKNVTIEVAKSSYDQQTGLMYRKSMKADRGMLFVYDDERPRPNFYMKNTHFSLDLIYINADKKVVDINENAKPFDESPLPSKASAKYVLEVNGGMAEKWGVAIGDKVSIQSRI